jgi:hypothetical protein
MSYYEYKDEAMGIKTIMDFVQREKSLHKEGTLGWLTLEVELVGLRIKYYDVLYDMYESIDKVPNSKYARSMMEQCIRQQDRLKESLAILSR